MTSTVEFEPSQEKSGGVGEKRNIEDVGVSLMENEGLAPPLKRIKGGRERNLKKVAEMVLVLAAMGRMRGGKGPTAAEEELMAEARNSLTKACEFFAPKDVFPRDVFGGVMEDLGLNKLKEQRPGFRPPKISIAEKLLLSKRKMEKVEDFSVPSTPHLSQRLQGNPGATVENRSASHPLQVSHLAKANHISVSPQNLPVVHDRTSSSAPLPYQLPTSEIRSIVSSALPSSHLGSAALPRVDRPNLRPDGRSNGAMHRWQVRANYSANSTVRNLPWLVQPQSVSPAKIGSEIKVPNHMSLKVEGAADVKSGLPTQAAYRTSTAQTTIPPSQGTNYVQSSLVGNAHAEIGKIVQKFLHPEISRRPVWNPSSRDYMNKPLTCQICMSAVTEIDSILICDACEKGYHLKCLQRTDEKGVLTGEWHCGKCLLLSGGKPLPPKYGRVMRNSDTPKVSLNPPAESPACSEKSGASDDKLCPLKITANGNVSPQNVPTGDACDDSNHQKLASNGEDVKGIQENDNVSSRDKMDDEVASSTCPTSLMKITPSECVLPRHTSVEKKSDEKMVELKSNSSTKLEMVPNSPDKTQEMVNAQDENMRLLNDEASQTKQSLENYNMVTNSKESHCNETTNNGNQLRGQEVIHDHPSEIAATTGVVNRGMSSSDGLHSVTWVGDSTHALDDKIYYESCHINGHVYSVMDHVLVRFESDKIIPSKLQAMWEDTNTAMKWLTVNRCYFPSDLPEAVGRPCGLESREVYESTCDMKCMAGLIESPCEVLPSRKYEEESERRSRTGTQLNDHLPPLYLCKWIYDEAKGLFRDMTYLMGHGKVGTENLSGALASHSEAGCSNSV